MEKQCVLNHPYHADLGVAMVSKGLDGKTTPVQMGVPGEIVRDSDGRQKIVMNMDLPGLKEPMQMVMIFDPPAGKIIILDAQHKQKMVREMPQVHCAPQPAAPDFKDLTQAGMKVTELGTRDFGELRGTGYKLDMELPTTDQHGKPATGAAPTPMHMEMWMDMGQSIPLSVMMKVGDAMNMDMEFSNVKLGEPSAAEFKVPDGYTEMKLPAEAKQ